MSLVRKLFLFGLSVLLLSCRTSPPPMEDFFLLPPLRGPLWESTEYTGFKILKEMDESNSVGGAAAALDIGSFSVVLTPADRTGRGETRSSATSDFVRSENIQLGINGSPFSRVDVLNRSGRPMDIIGVQINDRVTVSPPAESFDALFVLNDGSIQMGSQSSVPPDTQFALGGFHMLLEDGTVLGGNKERHPRTAVGLSEDGKTLILAVFDGRQENRAGLTTEETALWMSWLGCSTALNLDGGGSSAMVLKDRQGKIHVLNTPIHRGRPGLERAVGNNLGFRFTRP